MSKKVAVNIFPQFRPKLKRSNDHAIFCEIYFKREAFIHNYYSYGKIIFSQVSVNLFTGRGWVSLIPFLFSGAGGISGTRSLLEVGMSRGRYSPPTVWVCLAGGYVQEGWVLTSLPQIRGTWDTTGYGRQVDCTDPTGMLSCS